MTGDMPSPDELRRALDVARGELLDAMAGLTERDFAADLGEGITVVTLLAELARSEHVAIARAREAAGLAPRPTTEVGASAARPLPPQVTHALAGTRYEARLLLDALSPAEAVDPTIAAALLEGCAAAEHDAATRIAARPNTGPDQPPPRLQFA